MGSREGNLMFECAACSVVFFTRSILLAGRA